MRAPNRSRLPLCLFMLAAFAGPTCAQQEEAGAPVSQVEIRGSSASYDPRRDDTATRTVIGREELSRYGDRSVLDVLRRVPGVTVDANQARGGTIRMRGLGAGYTQILINGERPPGGFDFDSLLPDVIERIEVLRAATADLSTQSVAGTVNIVLRHVAKERERQLKLGMLQSSQFRGPNAALQLSERGEGLAWSLAGDATAERYDRAWSIFEETIAPGGAVGLARMTSAPEEGRMRRMNLAPRVEWTLADGDTVSVETFVNVNRFRNRTHLSVAADIGPPPPVPDQHTRMRADAEDLRSDLKWTTELDSGATLETKLGLSGENADNTILRRGADSLGVPVTDGWVDSGWRDRGVNSTGKYMRKLENGHAIAAGWDGGIGWRDEMRHERDAIRLFPPELPLDETFEARVARMALYAQDEWNITPQWSMYLGLRWEGIRIRASGDSFAATRSSSNVWSPILQTLWKIPDRKGDQLRFAVTRTYKAPDLWNLLPRRQVWENNSATEADFQGNPELKPELAWGLDAGYEHYWAENAMVALRASLRRIEDYTSNRIYFDGYRWIFTPVNDGRAEVRTLELETRFPLASLFAHAPAIDVRAGVSRNWARVKSVPGPDNRLERQTPLSANVGLDYKAGALALGGSVAFTRNGQVRVTANRGYYSEARTDLEAYAAWRVDPKRQVRLSLSNLAHEDSGFEVTYADPVAGVEKRRFHYPGAVRIQANYELKF